MSNLRYCRPSTLTSYYLQFNINLISAPPAIETQVKITMLGVRIRMSMITTLWTDQAYDEEQGNSRDQHKDEEG